MTRGNETLLCETGFRLDHSTMGANKSPHRPTRGRANDDHAGFSNSRKKYPAPLVDRESGRMAVFPKGTVAGPCPTIQNSRSLALGPPGRRLPNP